MEKKITVLGDGAWGTAIATVLAHNGYSVTIWCHNKEVAETITKNHRNDTFLPGIILADSITATTDIAQAVQGSAWIFEAVPVKHMRSVLHQAKQHVLPDQSWVMLSKGIEQVTLMFPSQIVDDVVGYTTHKVVVSGPSFAHDLSRKKITGVVVASDDSQRAHEVQTLLRNEYCRTHFSYDMIGVQVAGALKNVLALCVGMLDGAGFGDNTKTYVLIKGLQEMTTLTQALGGKQETVYDLAGIGDLMLTALGKHSRNVAIGKRLGAGESLQELITEFGTAPEGVNTTTSIYQLMHKESLQLPLCTAIYNVIVKGVPVESILEL